jgi:kumamolisin
MAPKARLILVESDSNDGNDIVDAIILAGTLVSAAGGGELTMSFSFTEFPEEAQLDDLFTAPVVVYFASMGDAPGAVWPATSRNVVAAGGTTISRDSPTRCFLLKSAWQATGGDPSLFEPRPHFQDRLARILGPTRGTPDLSFDANPATGVWVVDTNPFEGQPGGLFIVGGTSLSSPTLVGIVNHAAKFFSSSQA